MTFIIVNGQLVKAQQPAQVVKDTPRAYGDETRFNPMHDPHSGKFASKGGIGGGPAGIAGVKEPAAIAGDLRAGRPTTCSQDQVGSVLAAVADPPPANLSKLQVTGPANENCFQKHGREIPREKMPQLPGDVAGLQPFANALAARGVKASLERVDPRTLVATQNQLSAPKVAKLARLMYEGGWQKDGVILTSREGYVLDGHHRWSSACVAIMLGRKGLKINALKIDLPIDELLPIANKYSGARKGIGEAA